MSESSRDPQPSVVTYIYDCDGELSECNTLTTFTYDAESVDRIEIHVPWRTNQHFYRYDDEGRLLRITHMMGPDGPDFHGPFAEPETPSRPPYLFDERGRLMGYIDRDGATVLFRPQE